MLPTAFETRLVRALTHWAHRPAYPLVVAAVALAATVSMSLPFGSVLVLAVLLAPRRWVAIAGAASLGAALGGLLLLLFFHHLGWAQLAQAYPEIVHSKAWLDAERWLDRWGVWALGLLAASPLPLTPALMLCALLPVSLAPVLLALWLGKLAKYLLYAGLSARFPQGLMRRGLRRLAALGLAAQQAEARNPNARPPTQP